MVQTPRRSVLKGAASVSALGLAGCLGDDNGNGDQANVMNVNGVTTSRLEDYSHLYDNTDISEVNWSPAPHTGIGAEVLEGDIPDQYSLMCHINGVEGLIGETIKEIDTDRIEHFDEIDDFFFEDYQRPEYEGELVGVPQIGNADSFAYFEPETGEQETYEAWFSDEFNGQVALWNDPVTSLVKPALYLKEHNMADITSEEESDMTPEEIEEVADFMIEQKEEGQFITFWDTFEEAVDLMTAQDAVIVDAWEPTVFEVADRGIDGWSYANDCEEGFMKWTHNFMLLEGDEIEQEGMEDLAYDFIDYNLSGYFAAAITELRGYAAASPRGVEYAEESDEFDEEFIQERWDIVMDPDDGKLSAGKGTWFNQNAEHQDVYEQQWQRVLEA